MIIQAIYKLYPQVVRTVGDEAFDADGNEVTYDIALVEAEQAKEAKRQEAQAYLDKTDFKMTADYDKDTIAVRALRAEARKIVRGEI